MLLGKYVIFAALASMFLFPEEIFPALVGMAIILFVVLFVVELVLDVYIVVKVMMQDKREKNDEKNEVPDH